MSDEEDLTYEQNYVLTTAGSAGVTWALKEKPKKKQKKILCIYSGGMDSTVLLYDLINKGNQVEAIWFNYGQRHKKEHLFAEQICSKLGIEFTELDINYLDVNYLEDLLNVLDALAIAEEEDVLAQATSTQITGTMLGKDPDTQITALITGNVVSLRREVSESVRLDLDGGTAYTVILIQDGISNTIKINGGSDSVITITQSD